MSEAPSIDVTLFRALDLATRRVTASVGQELQTAAGVSLPEFEILRAVARSHGHRARPREIGDMLGWEKSRTSHQVTRMEKRGLLERDGCDSDMRGTWVTLTPEGVRAVTAAEPAYVAAVESHLGSAVSPSDMPHLAHQLLQISREANTTTCQAEVEALESALER